MFYPIAIETAGSWDDMAIELVEEIGRRTTVITQDTRETVFLFQRLSVALHARTLAHPPTHSLCGRYRLCGRGLLRQDWHSDQERDDSHTHVHGR